MFDFHCHILPGLDDGPADLDTALQMLKIAEEHGTTVIVATPHVIGDDFLPDWEDILTACRRLRNAAGEIGLDLRIYPGAEVAVNMELLKRITIPGPYCINGGRYMLVELPAMEIPGFAADFLFRLQSRGIIPILAHPERHPVLARNPEILWDWIQRGVLTQINGASFAGKMGKQAAALAELFLLNRMVHFIGSDAHGVSFRRPKLDEAAARIRKLAGKEMARTLLWENPDLIIQNQSLDLTGVYQITCRNSGKRLMR